MHLKVRFSANFLSLSFPIGLNLKGFLLYNVGLGYDNAYGAYALGCDGGLEAEEVLALAAEHNITTIWKRVLGRAHIAKLWDV